MFKLFSFGVVGIYCRFLSVQRLTSKSMVQVLFLGCTSPPRHMTLGHVLFIDRECVSTHSCSNWQTPTPRRKAMTATRTKARTSGQSNCRYVLCFSGNVVQLFRCLTRSITANKYIHSFDAKMDTCPMAKGTGSDRPCHYVGWFKSPFPRSRFALLE